MRQKQKVVVVLEYDAERHYAQGTISFAGPQSEMQVMVAKAERVPGVRYASDGLGRGNQELEFTLTANHAQTLYGAKQVAEAVVKALDLTMSGEMRVKKDRFRQKREPGSRGASNSLRVESPVIRGRRRS